jgi:hypothetical protein
MQAKPKQCAGCEELKPIWKNHLGKKYCKDCWYRVEVPKTPSSKKPLKPVSDKKDVLDVLYSKLRKEFLNKPENATCFAKLPCCQGGFKEELTVHHTKGRGRYYLDTKTWIALCMSCHQWVETHHEEAKEMNLSQHRI